MKSEELLYFYARFKQANNGPCNTSRPGLFDFQGKQKWDAWKKMGDKSRRDSMLEYVNELTAIDPEWEEKMDSGKVKPKSGMGVAVSTLHDSDEAILDVDKSIYDWCKEGNIEQVIQRLNSKDDNDVNALDQNGLALLHWACDRGLEEMVNVLLNRGANINVQDCDGQTPLHYAASCEHLYLVRLLLCRGADVNLMDSDGTSAINSTDNADIVAMLAASCS